MLENDTHPRILIMGSLPYFKDSQSRAFDSYFFHYPKECLRQIYSSPRVPKKGHCESFFQITDYDLFKSRFSRRKEIGHIYQDENLMEQDDVGEAEIPPFYRLGKKKTPLKRFFRKWIWGKTGWLSNKLENWVEEFKPQVIFLAWSDDFYALEISLYFSNKYDVPIISCIGDDYIFNDRLSISPIYYFYKYLYKKLAFKILKNTRNHEIYIDDKINEFYSSYFKKNGTTVYVSTDNKVYGDFLYNKDIKKIIYFGNLGYGRLQSIAQFASSLESYNNNISISIYSNQSNQRINRELRKHKNIHFAGRSPYHKLKKITEQHDAVLVIESLNNKKAIKDVRFSLSTKVADALSSGKLVFGVGNTDCGAINFLSRHNCAVIVTSTEQIVEAFDSIKDGIIDLSQLARNANSILKIKFDKEANYSLFEKVVKKTADNGGKQ